MTYRTTLLCLGAAALAACSHTPQSGSQGRDGARGTGYLQDGPTVRIDAAPPDRTTLELLDQRTREAARLKQELEAARAAATEAGARATLAERSQGELATRIGELEKLLARQSEENKELMDELLKARIARLRIERQMIQGRIADLVDEKK